MVWRKFWLSIYSGNLSFWIVLFGLSGKLVTGIIVGVISTFMIMIISGLIIGAGEADMYRPAHGYEHHDFCPNCHLCKTCGDCQEYGCKSNGENDA